MNIIHPIEDKRGITWALHAASNRFMIVWKNPGESTWFMTSDQLYNDPDPAIKALKRRVELMNASYCSGKSQIRQKCERIPGWRKLSPAEQARIEQAMIEINESED